MKRTPAGLLVFVFIALSCARIPAQSPNPAPSLSPTRVACVGDSLTEGAMSTRSYPTALAALLGPGWEVKNFGVGGCTLLKKGDHPYWPETAYAQAKAFQPNVVIIMLGSNDTKPDNWKHVDEFRADYTELVNSFKTLDSKPKIYICRPAPVFGDGNYGINDANLEREMPLLDRIATEEGATIIDLHAPLLGHPELAPDRIHPNADGDAIMAKVVADKLTASSH